MHIAVALEDDNQNCDVCGFLMDCQHKRFMMHDNYYHWYSCENCEADISNRVSYSFNGGYYYKDTAKHYQKCDGCSYKEAEGEAHVDEKWEAHTTTNGTCEVCKMQVSAYDDVYVGGVGLKDGEYLDNSGNVSATQPTDGSSQKLTVMITAYDGNGKMIDIRVVENPGDVVMANVTDETVKAGCRLFSKKIWSVKKLHTRFDTHGIKMGVQLCVIPTL